MTYGKRKTRTSHNSTSCQRVHRNSACPHTLTRLFGSSLASTRKTDPHWFIYGFVLTHSSVPRPDNHLHMRQPRHLHMHTSLTHACDSATSLAHAPTFPSRFPHARFEVLGWGFGVSGFRGGVSGWGRDDVRPAWKRGKPQQGHFHSSGHECQINAPNKPGSPWRKLIAIHNFVASAFLQ